MSKNYAEYTSENGRYRVDSKHDEFWVMLKVDPEYDVIDKEWVYQSYEDMAEAWDGEDYLESDTQIEPVWCDHACPDGLDDEWPEPYLLVVTWHRYWLL